MRPYLVVLAWVIIWIVIGYLLFGSAGWGLVVAVIIGVLVPPIMPVRWLSWINDAKSNGHQRR